MDTENVTKRRTWADRTTDREMAQRMKQAIDNNPDVPQPNFGRLAWFQDQFEKRGKRYSPETIRKWLSGEARPRTKAMTQMAEILKVDESWLALGKAPVLDQKQSRLRNATADGMVNVVAGFIQAHGGSPAFPVENDKRAQAEHIDVYAIIRGGQYALHVVVASVEDRGWKFVIPTGAENAFILGVMQIGDLAVEMIEIDPDGLSANGTRRGGFWELSVNRSYEAGEHQFKRILNFRERL